MRYVSVDVLELLQENHPDVSKLRIYALSTLVDSYIYLVGKNESHLTIVDLSRHERDQVRNFVWEGKLFDIPLEIQSQIERWVFEKEWPRP